MQPRTPFQTSVIGYSLQIFVKKKQKKELLQGEGCGVSKLDIHPFSLTDSPPQHQIPEQRIQSKR